MTRRRLQTTDNNQPTQCTVLLTVHPRPRSPPETQTNAALLSEETHESVSSKPLIPLMNEYCGAVSGQTRRRYRCLQKRRKFRHPQKDVFSNKTRSARRRPAQTADQFGSRDADHGLFADRRVMRPIRAGGLCVF